MQDLFGLKGKVAIVTGGNGGIGKGIASGLAGAGAGVVIAARNPEKTAVAVKEIAESSGARVLGVQVDVTRQEQIQSLVEQTLGEFGRIDILVNNAGINIRKMPQDYLPEEWDQIMDANLRAPFLLCQAVYPSMKKAGGGKIINIGSMTTIFGGAKLVPYGTSKGGIVQMTRALAAAWAPDNIQVNAVLPGWIDTPLTRQARIDLPGLNERVVARTPAGRWGDPNDFRGTAVFLASPASDFLTGVALPVDGGYSIMIG
jgi:2-deoxy-D-gluconate 3-dehydrogenase